MKAYVSLFRIRFIAALQYRAAAFAELFTNFLWGMMEILAFAAFYRANPDGFSMTFSQTVSYMWMQQAFLMLFRGMNWDTSLPATIESGTVAYELVRPSDLYYRWFVQSAASRLANTALRCWPILLIAFLLPDPYALTLPPDFSHFLLFLLSLLLSVGVVVSFSMLMYITVFYTMSSRGVKLVAGQLCDFLSGAIIPLTFFPPVLRAIIELTPFAAMQNMPLRIYSGNFTLQESLEGICLQLVWLFVLWSFGYLWMRRSLRRVVVQGG